MIEDALTNSIRDRKATIGIFGLGYVGLPLALLFVRKGFNVVGLDVDDNYVGSLCAGRSRVGDVSDEALLAALESGRFEPTTNAEEIRAASVYIICVPTPLSKSRQPDLSYIEHATHTLLGVWEPNKLVVLESTTYPGTTEDYLLPLLSNGNLALDRDFLLAFSPERVDPGNHAYPLATIPKVVGGVSDASTRVATKLYESVFEKVHPVSNAKAAELSKLLENTFRNVNVALANEFKQICDTLKVDVWEVIEAAKTKPFGFMPFYPGPGIGGHCIPLDPQYLVFQARLSGYEPRLVALADAINQEMPRYTVQQVMDRLNEQGKALKGSRVLIIGIAYKPDVADLRESPALSIIEQLHARGADVAFTDPLVPALKLESGLALENVPLTKYLLDWADLAVVITAHSTFDYSMLGIQADKVLDTRNALGQHTGSGFEANPLVRAKRASALDTERQH